MFAEQIQAFMNAGMTVEQAQILCQCLNVLSHNGRIYLEPNLNPNGKDGALNIRVGRGKKAIRVTQGDISVEGPYNTFVYNGQSDTIRFRNDSGETVPYGGVMQITGNLIDDAGLRFLTITKPNTPATSDTSYPRLYGINCTFPGVFPDDKGVCSRGGLGVVLFDDSGTPDLDQSWGAKSGQWSLSINRDGFTMQGPAINQSIYALIEQRELITAAAHLTGGDLTQGSFQEVTIQDGVQPNGDIEYKVTAYDRLLLSGKKNPNGSTLDLTWRSGKWWVSGAKECPT